MDIFPIENVRLVVRFFNILYTFFVSYLNELPDLNEEAFFLMKECEDIILLGLKTGIKYFSSFTSKDYEKLFEIMKM